MSLVPIKLFQFIVLPFVFQLQMYNNVLFCMRVNLFICISKIFMIENKNNNNKI